MYQPLGIHGRERVHIVLEAIIYAENKGGSIREDLAFCTKRTNATAGMA